MQHTSASGQARQASRIFTQLKKGAPSGKNYRKRDINANANARTTYLVNTLNNQNQSIQNNIGEIEKKLFLSEKFPLIGIVYKDNENKMFVVDHYVTPDEDAVDKPIAIIYYEKDSTPHAMDKFDSFTVADMSEVRANSFPIWMNLVNPENESETTTVFREESDRRDTTISENEITTFRPNDIINVDMV